MSFVAQVPQKLILTHWSQYLVPQFTVALGYLNAGPQQTEVLGSNKGYLFL